MSIKNELKDFLKGVHPKWRSRKIINKPEYVDYLTQLYPDYTLANKITFFMDGLEKQPMCQVCNNKLNDIRKTTCSTKCREQLKKDTGKVFTILDKMKNTMFEQYGVDNPSKVKELVNKRHQTCIKKYGAKVSLKTRQKARERSSTLNAKGRQTLKARYGVDNPGQLPDHRKKCKNTMLKNYGEDHYTKTEKYKKEVNEKRKNKWNLFSPNNIKITNLSQCDNTINANDRISFICELCNKTQTIPSETFKWRINHVGSPCIHCTNLNIGSKKENDLYTFILSICPDAEKNVRYILENNKELDIYSPSKKIAIEFCGLYWHNDLRIDKHYHRTKYKECKEKGIRLITIFEDEWDHKKQIVLSRLTHLFSKSKDVIYARSCIVKKIKTKEAKEFIEKHHIQGYTPSTHKYGLFYDNDLIGVMTFSKPNLSKGHRDTKYEWELSRFCTKKRVTGGASKLLKYFISEIDPATILSYCDLRWGNGGVYSKLGFIEDGVTAINYWYILGNKRLHRFNLRKTSEDDPNLTEYENRLKQGYLRIWDCGNGKWVWRR